MQTNDTEPVPVQTRPEEISDGFYTENLEDGEQNIYTKVYPNGNKVKRTMLPASKEEAVVRELLGKDTKEITRFMDKDPEKYQMAAVAVATTIGGSRQQFEYYETMKMKDFSRLLSMYQDLNF